MEHRTGQRNEKDHSAQLSVTQIISTKNTQLPNFILSTDILPKTGAPGTETTIIIGPSFQVPTFLSSINYFVFIRSLILVTTGIYKISWSKL